ncbi:helix-hairpin-helix domain-containing protein [Enterococcus nangangensis]
MKSGLEKATKQKLMGVTVVVVLLLGVVGYGVRQYVFKAPSETEWWADSTTASSMELATSTTATETLIYIDLKGAVASPGVYALARGSRLFEALALAGGLSANADLKRINQAQILVDQSAVYLPAIGEEIEEAELPVASGAAESTTNNTLVNLNTADTTVLQTLPGIGAVKAQAIIQYRQEHGLFKNVEDLLQVAGIGEATFTNVKDLITISENP